ncbi:MAG: VOC family protein [Candidatus Poribacteria bacterium]|nr:VOC family protein [Candidatus Poribacteria bacterium]
MGFMVDDADAVRQRLEEAGYSEGTVVDPHPYRKRIYFLDNNNMEWEFVEYFSDNPSERNEYS